MVFDGLDGLLQELTRRDDGHVGGSQELFSPVDDRAHALLDCPVLSIDAVDPGERLGFLDFPVQHVVVVTVADRPEAIGGVHVFIEVMARVFQGALIHGQRVCAPTVSEVVDHYVVVVHWYPEMAVDHGFSVGAGPELSEGHDILVAPHEGLVFAHRSDAEIAVAIVGGFHLDVRGRALQEWGVGRDARLFGLIGQFAVQDGRMRGVYPAFHRLQPVAFLPDFGHVPMGRRDLSQLEFRRRRSLVSRAQIGPYHAAHIQGWVSGYLDSLFELARFVHLVDTITFHVELPAMVHAPDPALLVAPEIQAGAAVWAGFLDQADLAVGAAEGEEFLAHQAHPHRRAVGLRYLHGE